MRSDFKPVFTRAAFCALSVLLATGANFQALAEDGEPVVIEAIVVEGLVTATEGATAITGEDLRREQPTTVDEVFRNTPGVEGLQGPGRQFGDVNIRGVDGAGAVVVSVDGAEKNSVEVKHGIAFNPIFFNADFLKRVTVVKGAVSNVYGAGSIGGKIVLETIDPVDLIDPEQGHGAQVGFGGESNGPGFSGLTAGAVQLSDRVAVLGGLSYRDYDSYKDGDGEEVLNSGSEIAGGLAKAVFTPTDDSYIEVAYNYGRHQYIGSNVYGRANFRQDADYDNAVTDQGVTWHSFYGPLDWLSFDVSAFYTMTEHDEELLQARAGSRSQPGDFDNRKTRSYGGTGYSTILSSHGDFEHSLDVGGSLSLSQLAVNTETGGTPTETAGDRLVYGTFVQDRIRYRSLLEVIPGLRYERYDMETDDGADSSGGELLPKLTVAVTPFEGSAFGGMQIHGSYARGLRAPRLQELTLDEQSSRTRSGQTTITNTLANPGLEAELSDQFEVGVRFNRGKAFTDDDRLRLSVVGFRNNISNRVEEVTLSRVQDGNTTTITEQTQNIGKATIQGLEVGGNYDTDAFFLGGTLTATSGENEETGEDLNSVRPLSGTLYGGPYFLGKRLRVGLEGEFFKGKNEVGQNLGVIGDSSAGASLFNVFAAYRPNDWMTVDARVNNVLNRQHRKFDQIDPGAGLNAKLSVRINF